MEVNYCLQHQQTLKKAKQKERVFASGNSLSDLTARDNCNFLLFSINGVSSVAIQLFRNQLQAFRSNLVSKASFRGILLRTVYLGGQSCFQFLSHVKICIYNIVLVIEEYGRVPLSSCLHIASYQSSSTDKSHTRHGYEDAWLWAFLLLHFSCL